LVEAPPDPGGVQVQIPASPLTRAPIAVAADHDAARITFGGREILRTTTGMAIAAWTREGLFAAFSISPGSAPPTLPTPYAVYPLRRLLEPRAIGADSIDLTADASSGSLVFKTNSGVARLVLYAGRSRPLAPSLLETSAREWPLLEVQEYSGDSSASLTRALDQDGIPPDDRLRKLPHVYRIVVHTNWNYGAAVRLGLGGVPDVVYGRLLDGAPGSIFSVDVLTHLARIDERTLSFHMARDHQAQLVGAGWSDLQADAIAGYREVRGREAELLIPMEEPHAVRIGVQLIAIGSGEQTAKSVQMRFNDLSLETISPSDTWQRYWWNIPAEAVRPGVNSLALTVGPASARLAVSDVLIEEASN
jgi:hypothetical protein